ncbi:hypothetical protein LCGC14_2483750 [marine sediment metagenome]|uniref:Uncharacterized protein n=1 Tax=marine sediment metagenome TaxID=412755 RepID=A0A0F9B6Q6_9ZZZZ
MSKRPLMPEKDSTSIGNILVEMELISKEELDDLVLNFKVSKEELLGEFIVRETQDSKRRVTTDHIELAMMRQRALRNGRPTHAAMVTALKVASKLNDKVISTTEELVALTTSLANKI